jgi:hypothetical protein
MARIVDAEARPDYRLGLRFDDGTEGEVDLSSLVGKGVFAVWSDPAAFARVLADPESGTVAWPGGIDLCPDQLYHDVTNAPVPGATLRA